MERLAQLSAHAARLMLRFVEIGGVKESVEDSMEAIGGGKPAYYRARKELVKLGFLSREGDLMPPYDRFGGETPPPPPPAAPAAVAVPDRDFWDELSRGWVKPRELAMQVDLLPWSGVPTELNRINSPAQKRKRVQVQALKAIVRWETGWEITDRNAKDMLTAQGESVEEVYEILTEVWARVEAQGKKLDTPGAYLVGACRRSKPAVPSTPVYLPPQPADVDPGPLPDEEFHDARWEAQMAEQAKLREQGVDLTKPQSRRWKL